MDATTSSLSRRARSTSAMWPACSAPIVGTSATDAAARTRGLRCSCRHSSTEWTTLRPSGPALSPAEGAARAGGALPLRPGSSEAEAAHPAAAPPAGVLAPPISRVCPNCRSSSRTSAGGMPNECSAAGKGELAREARDHAVVQAEDVVEDLHLSAGANAGADADGRHANLASHKVSHWRRHHLEHEREAAGLLERVSFVDQPAGRVGRLALHAVAAQLRVRLGCEADVTHHRHARVDQRAHLGLAGKREWASA
eukprot:scaffold5356_cov118-Isochrysis_galbana.AAC.5